MIENTTPLVREKHLRETVRRIIAPWLNGDVSFEEWCESVDRIFPAPPTPGVEPPLSRSEVQAGTLRTALRECAVANHCEAGHGSEHAEGEGRMRFFSTRWEIFLCIIQPWKWRRISPGVWVRR